MARQRNYQAEYSRRRTALARRLGLSPKQVSSSPLLRDMARGHTPSYYTGLSEFEQETVIEYIRDHPRTPVGKTNISKAAKFSDLDALRRPWRQPEAVRPLYDKIQETKSALNAAVKGFINSQKEVEKTSKRGGPEDLYIGWSGMIPASAPQPPESRRRRPRDLTNPLDMRQAFELLASIRPPYIWLRVDQASQTLQIYTT